MKILGIDYGRRKIGLAMAESALAEPYKVVRVQSLDEAVSRVGQIVQVERVERVVVGLSEGTMAEESREFGEKLQARSGIPVSFQDETLSTQDAQRKALEAGVNRKKRRALDDAYSAALILQNYLDMQDL